MMQSKVGNPEIVAWANRPSATGGMRGKIINVSDVGSSGTLFFSNGTNWIPVSPIVYTYGGPALTAPVNTSENTVATITIPGGLIGPKGSICGDILYSHTYSSNTKTLTVRFGGTVVVSGTQAACYTSSIRFLMFNGNSVSAQKAYPVIAPYGNSGSSVMNTLAINTAANANLTLSLQKATAGEALAIEGYVITVNQGL